MKRKPFFHLGTAGLELCDERNVVALVLGVDVALLEDKAHYRGIAFDARGRGVLLGNRHETRAELALDAIDGRASFPRAKTLLLL